MQPTSSLPEHLRTWQLPPGWKWGSEGLLGDQRHYQELIDGLGRSLALVTAPEPSHSDWLQSEARYLAHRSHPAIPTTYHYWTLQPGVGRGPGYLRRWITGVSVRSHLSRRGTAEIPYVLQVLRGAGSALSYMHDSGTPHGAVGADSIWVTPTGRLWLLEWQWAVPQSDIPSGLSPTGFQLNEEGERFLGTPPPEWRSG